MIVHPSGVAVPRRPIRTATRAAAVAAVLTGAVACGGGAEPDAPTSGGGDGAWPVTIANKFGTTEIPAEPERVVTVGFNDQDFVLALGVSPVGVRANLGDYDVENRPWAQEQLAGVAELPTVGGQEIDVEAVAALQPDLIIGVYSFMDQATYDQLSGIAPTLAQTDEYTDGATPWQEQTLLTGEALGREDEAQELVDEVERQFADAAERNPDFDGQALVVDFAGVAGSAHYLFGTDDLRTQFFTDLGFDVADTSTEVSPERLDLLDQDVLIGGGYPEDEGLTDPLFAGLDVVSQDRTVYLGGYDGDVMGALGYGSPLSLPYLLEQLVPPLAQAADGDPATAVEQPTV
ncbi:iron-siderophore ABC transporter substrate-binding protein [Modestobacter lapidis]|nr:iron-siderophore ABC transporter substrate-binding protein [Modestobacter lapidis]